MTQFLLIILLLYPSVLTDLTISVSSISVITPVSLTAYTSHPSLTDDSPWVTAFNTKCREGTVAISRDLEDKVRPGEMIRIIMEDGSAWHYEVNDRMNKRIRRGIDIWLPSMKEARKFGRRKGLLVKSRKVYIIK